MSAGKKPLPPTSDGLPVYCPQEVPAGLLHKTALGEKGLKPAAGQQPLGYVRYYRDKLAPLYDEIAAVPKRVFSPEHRAKLQQAAARRFACPGCDSDMRDHPAPAWGDSRRCADCAYRSVEEKIAADRAEAISWAKEVIAGVHGEYLLGDTETAWLHGPVCELALTDLHGRTVFSRLINPQVSIHPDAQAVHRISDDMVRQEPTFTEVFAELSGLLAGRRVLFWNRNYDVPVLHREAVRHFGLPWDTTADAARDAGPDASHRYGQARQWTAAWDSECLMEWYAQFYGAYDPEDGDYRWQKLGGDHRALGDCRTMARRLAEMANDRGSESSEGVLPAEPTGGPAVTVPSQADVRLPDTPHLSSK